MPVRILHIVTYMGRGGLETMLMNYYRHIDRNKVQFDFLVHRDFEADYDAEIHSLGGRIYHMPRLIPWSAAYREKLTNFFRDHPEYRIVHVHQDCLSSVALQCAKEAGVPVRIAHSHNNGQDINLKYPIKLYYRREIPRYATDLFACSQEAGRWMFRGCRFHVLKNAIDTEKYVYSEQKASDIRNQLGLKGRFVVGHVGRFSPQKNHSFLIDIFYRYLQYDSSACLMLVGDGTERKKIENKVQKLGIENQVLFLGNRTDVSDLMQAMDVFVFPSHYEGLGISAVEAQASGLPCLISDRISKECQVTKDLVHWESLDEPPEKWADDIKKIRYGQRTNHSREIDESGYDIHRAAKKLERFYLRKWEKVSNKNVAEPIRDCLKKSTTGNINTAKNMPAGDSHDPNLPFLTVFTPAYNRADLLPRTYQSLFDQECKEFIWLIVDDGSTDNTRELVSEWQKQSNGFKIEYIYKENGGMHTAHNTAYEHICTELNVCIDSDDKMAPGAVRKIKEAWKKVRNKGYAGLIALDADMATGQIIGSGFPEGMKATTLGGYYAHGGSGDKKLIYRTDVITSVPPYPIFPGEKYVGLVYKYTLVDQHYQLAVLNDVICEVEYQADGSSGTMWKQYLKNPRGFAFLRKVFMKYPTSTKRLIMDCIHYCSSSEISHNRNYIKESPRKALTVLCTPAGWALTAYIRKKQATVINRSSDG